MHFFLPEPFAYVQQYIDRSNLVHKMMAEEISYW